MAHGYGHVFRHDVGTSRGPRGEGLSFPLASLFVLAHLVQDVLSHLVVTSCSRHIVLLLTPLNKLYRNLFHAALATLVNLAPPPLVLNCENSVTLTCDESSCTMTCDESSH